MADTFHPEPGRPPGPAARLLVREAVEGDAGRLSEFMTTTFLAANGHCAPAADVRTHVARSYSAERQAAEIAAADRLTLIATVDGSWAGYAQLRLPAAPPQGPSAAEALELQHPAELARFYFGARFHGSGAAARLLEETMQRAAVAGARTLWLCVWQDSLRAVRFYRKHGFGGEVALPLAIGSTPVAHWRMHRPLA